VRGRIIGLLRRRAQSIEELATELDVTDNAVRAHVQTLEREGLVHARGVRREGTVGKPATLFAIAPEAEPLFSTAYAPVLQALVAALGEQMDDKQLHELFREVGRKLVPQPASGKAQPTLEQRVKAAATLLEALGGELEVSKSGDGYNLRGFACPLSAAVRVQPSVCLAVQELVSGIVQLPVRECCERGAEGSRCCFMVNA
jgi:predicted ArsR family transcriptional regulator